MPANVTALVMTTDLSDGPGAALACRAREHEFEDPQGTAHARARRGVTSYYAARTLPHATTTDNWLARIAALVEADVRSGALPAFKRPDLCWSGPPLHLP